MVVRGHHDHLRQDLELGVAQMDHGALDSHALVDDTRWVAEACRLHSTRLVRKRHTLRLRLHGLVWANRAAILGVECGLEALLARVHVHVHFGGACRPLQHLDRLAHEAQDGGQRARIRELPRQLREDGERVVEPRKVAGELHRVVDVLCRECKVGRGGGWDPSNTRTHTDLHQVSSAGYELGVVARKGGSQGERLGRATLAPMHMPICPAKAQSRSSS